MIVLIANPKGGTGKTMLAHQLAFLFAFRKMDVAVVDLHNPEDSDGIYFPVRYNYRNVQMPYSFHLRPGRTVHNEIDTELGKEFVIMDPVSGRMNAHHYATSIADKIVVPVHCSPPSYMVTSRYLENYINDPRFGAVLIEFPATKDFLEETRSDLEQRLKISTLSESIPWSRAIDMAMDVQDSLLNMPVFPFYAEKELNIPNQFLHLVDWLSS